MDFKDTKKIRLGIWGLGRGMSFYKSCEFLNIEVVAGCDYNEHMRKNFLESCPDAFATADQDEFLAYDMDAVLVATFCPAHAGDSIAALKAGKHVLSEVTAFHTMGEGVELVEAVESMNLVYNLAENYPFTKPMMYITDIYKKGVLGELQYAEVEYVHECRNLMYCYIDRKPVEPGNTVHNWRSWINYHYYNTHSLGVPMVMTGLRPTRVVALPSPESLPGSLTDDVQSVSPSLITLENGALVRNFMGATTGDGHTQRFWGTLGSALSHWGLHLQLGGKGNAPMFEVEPTWPELGEMAEQAGHGGGDFWVLYYFAREIREGTSAPFDIYTAANCTAAGILAYRSGKENGTAYDIPDFKNKSDREAWRGDDFAQARFDVKKGVFPEGADLEITGNFTTVMNDLINHSTLMREVCNWEKLYNDVKDEVKEKLLDVYKDACEKLPAAVEVYGKARAIAEAYPESPGGKVLLEMLELGEEEKVLGQDFESLLKRVIGELKTV